VNPPLLEPQERGLVLARALERMDEILGPSGSFEHLLMGQVRFLEHRDLDWDRVRRARYFAYQQFQYVYSSLARDLSQQLVVKPPNQHGDQRLLDFKLSVEPIPLSRTDHTDAFGNPVIELQVARVNHWTTFEVLFCTERRADAPKPRITEAQARILLEPTRLTAPDARILGIAQKLQATSSTPLELAEQISDWVSQTMRYQHDVTHVGTNASEALQVGAGLCQDYAHVALAICRAAGLPARYVSGHMLGEGGSHAWLEVIVPNENGALEAVGFDPTNRRRPNLGYATVAVGRDYADVPPTSGRFVGDHAGDLRFEKRAGLIELEFDDGRVLNPNLK
jgi:transglutaminase-like putative cysteine protease